MFFVLLFYFIHYTNDYSMSTQDVEISMAATAAQARDVNNRCSKERGQRIGINGGLRHAALQTSGTFFFFLFSFFLTFLTFIFFYRYNESGLRRDNKAQDVNNRCSKERGQRIGINGGLRRAVSRTSGTFFFSF